MEIFQNITTKTYTPKRRKFYYFRTIVKDSHSNGEIYLAERFYTPNGQTTEEKNENMKNGYRLFETELVRDWHFDLVDVNQGYTFERDNRFVVDYFWLTPANETMYKFLTSRVIQKNLINTKGVAKYYGNLRKKSR